MAFSVRLLALSVGILALGVLMGCLFSRRKAKEAAPRLPRGKVVDVHALPAEHVTSLMELYGEPPGEFLSGRDGITHFYYEAPSTSAWSMGSKQLAILAHGIGTSHKVYDGVRTRLLAAGFRVLAYDFFGHGWSSKYENVSIDAEVLVNQLKELADHVLKPSEAVDLFVGHSTGGIVGVLAAARLERSFRRLALISPAFWKVAPLTVKIGDVIPSLVYWVASIKALNLVPTAYLENMDNAFAHEGGKYFLPEIYERSKANVRRMFELHPQILEAVIDVTKNILRADVLVEQLKEFRALVGGQVQRQPPKIGLFWGSHDIVVPTEHGKDVLSWPGSSSCATLKILDRLGHEAPVENASQVAGELVKFVSATR